MPYFILLSTTFRKYNRLSMTAEEQFSIILTRQVLTDAGEDIQLAVLDEMVADEQKISLDKQLEQAKSHSKQAGDFGMEILGPMLISALIEAGKALWKAYLKKLEEKAAGKLADLTVDQAQNLVNAIWHKADAPVTKSDYETALRSVAEKDGLTEDQTEHLLAAIRGAH
jgi:hypothetical protein